MSPEPRFPLILAHGQLMTPEVWGPVLAPLDRVARVQFAPVTAPSIAAMAQALLAEAPDRFDLVGLAMGGFVAFEVLRRAPERVRRLALIATLAEADNAAQRARRAGYARHVAEGHFAEVAEERVAIVLGERRRGDRAALDLVRRMARETGAETFLAQQQAILDRPDSRDDLPAIACPILIVRGVDDGITTPAHLADLQRGLPHARTVEIADCGHLVPIEQPGRLAEALLGWLGRETA